jgi:hypothetical protein
MQSEDTFIEIPVSHTLSVFEEKSGDLMSAMILSKLKRKMGFDLCG